MRNELEEKFYQALMNEVIDTEWECEHVISKCVKIAEAHKGVLTVNGELDYDKVKEVIESALRVATDMKYSDYNRAGLIASELKLRLNAHCMLPAEIKYPSDEWIKERCCCGCAEEVIAEIKRLNKLC